MKTYWFCEQCQRVGVVEHDEWVDVVGVAGIVGSAHKQVSTSCHNTTSGLRVLNVTKLINGLPVWAVEPLAKLIEGRE